MTPLLFWTSLLMPLWVFCPWLPMPGDFKGQAARPDARQSKGN